MTNEKRLEKLYAIAKAADEDHFNAAYFRYGVICEVSRP